MRCELKPQHTRRRQETDGIKQQYAIRAGVEGTISQAVRGFEIRNCRYVGLTKTHLQHLFTAAAMNVVRVINWLEGVPLAVDDSDASDGQYQCDDRTRRDRTPAHSPEIGPGQQRVPVFP